MDITNEISKRINELASKNDGRVTPDMVVADAKRVTSPLHSLFDWDDSEAAHKWRIEQARTIIRSVKVTVTVDRKQVSTVAYVRDPRADSKIQGYRAVEAIRESKTDSREALAYELARAEAVVARVVLLSQAFGLEAEANKVRDNLTKLKRKFHGVSSPVTASQGPAS